MKSQRGSVLLFALIFMAVLASMALSGMDAASLATRSALNYRDHDRAFRTAESLLTALDASLLGLIRREGLSVAMDGLTGSETDIVMSPGAVETTGTSTAVYRADAAGFSVAPLADTAVDAVVCGPLYRVSVQASGRRPGTVISLVLERRICCDDMAACEAGDFVSMERSWRRAQEQRSGSPPLFSR
ncbi:MAG: PilX N-terminal domain-containing pilus assembly protein [Pseudohongiella sp.]|uniref:pilus assembly PilX family protein n=1 Tax=Pseudohongiella sp. TaxID=1979412 RepID=UPI00349FD99B